MKLISILIITLALSACGVKGDKFDNLIVVDGNGNKYQLKHNVLDTYFIREFPQKADNEYVKDANSKIKGE